MHLSATLVKNKNTPGHYGDGRGGHGLLLEIKPRAEGGVRKTWKQRIRIRGQVTHLGLGAYPVISLADARAKALTNAQTVANGGDPRRTVDVPTFQEVLEEVIELQRDVWDNPRSEKQWRASLDTYASSLASKSVVDITTADVRAVLEPIWNTKPETARRIRGRISKVMNRAIGGGHRLDNPAGLALGDALGPQVARKQHHRSVFYGEVSAAILAVQASGATPSTKLALEFLTLTACRSGEVRGCRWDEIDIETEAWTIPKERTKTRETHVVPLSTQAVVLLHKAQRLSDGSGLVFLSPTGKMLSDATMSKLMKELGLDGTPHGMRASFRSWCSDEGQPPDLAEKALGHAVRGVARSYDRGVMFDRRKELMQDWADYLDSGKTPQFDY